MYQGEMKVNWLLLLFCHHFSAQFCRGEYLWSLQCQSFSFFTSPATLTHSSVLPRLMRSRCDAPPRRWLGRRATIARCLDLPVIHTPQSAGSQQVLQPDPQANLRRAGIRDSLKLDDVSRHLCFRAGLVAHSLAYTKQPEQPYEQRYISIYHSYSYSGCSGCSCCSIYGVDEQPL